jgi:putative membrane protein
MKIPPMRSLPLVLALSLSFSMAVAQTTGSTGAAGGGTAGTGSSATAGRAAPAAQPGTGTRNAETRKDDKLARADRKFMQEAAEGGLFEVQAAQLASTKATDPNVKSFASKLVDEHTAANNELVQMANSKKVELPAAPPRGKRNEIEKLGKLSGNDFDQRFVREVGIKDHEKDIRKFEKASENAKDPELKAWIDKTLPHLREHLAQAQKMPQAGRDASAMGNRAAPRPEVGTGTGKGAATGTNTGGKTGS